MNHFMSSISYGFFLLGVFFISLNSFTFKDNFGELSDYSCFEKDKSENIILNQEKLQRQADNITAKRDFNSIEISQLYRKIELQQQLNLFSSLNSGDTENFSIRRVKSILKHRSEISSFSATAAGCPEIEFIDLRNVAGHPQPDDFTACGAADTLSMIIFTDSPGQVNGFEFEIDLPEGFEYAGWEYTNLGNTSITNINPKEDRPVFFVTGVTGDSLVFVNIGLKTNCNVDKNTVLTFDYNYSYTFIDTMGAVTSCSGTFTPALEFNSGVHIPVLNMLSPLDPVEVEISSLETSFCQKVQISQDGLSAYVDSFRFNIVGIDFAASDLILDSIAVNRRNYPLGGVTHDAGTMTSSFLIDGSYFPFNTLNNPSNNQMNTNEITEVEICYQVDDCPVAADIAVRYNASFGCEGEICETTDETTFIRIRPTGTLPPVATSQLNVGGIEICGNPGMVSIVMSNPNVDSEQNVYNDLQIGFQTCVKPNLEVTNINVGGVDLPSSMYSWVGDDINIDFSSNTNPNIGLEDYDMDTFYDDLRGGDTIYVEVEMSVVCTLSDECALIDCQDVQFYVEGVTNCNVTFKEYPIPDAFDLFYGPTSVSNPTEAQFGTSGVFGYDFGTYSNSGAPLATTNESAVEVEYCYTFDNLNIQDCPSTGINYLQIDFDGDPSFILDMQFVPNSDSLSIDGGATYTAVNDGVLTKIDDNNATLIIDGGSNNQNVCYKYSIEMDSCLCSPVQYFSAQQKVVHVCPDCSGGCEMLRACRPITFRVDPNCTGCDCIVQNRHVRSERYNLGYTDKTMTTKHTRQSLIDSGGTIDLTRFVPGDTLIHEDYFVIVDTLALQNLLDWRISWSFLDNGSTAARDIDNLELSLDAKNSILDEFAVSKVGGSKQTVDLTAFEGCLTDNVTNYGGVWNYFGKTPWGDAVDNVGSFNSSNDYSDNNSVSLYLWNYDKIESCGGANAHFGGGDCLDEFLAAFNVAVGDTLHFTWRAPLIKNPNRAALEAIGAAPVATNIARLYPTFGVYNFDPIAGGASYCDTYVGGVCQEWGPMYLDCPGGVDVVTRMNLTDCGGTVTHEFTINDFPGVVGDPWFTKEFRPFINIRDVDALIRAPLAYCADAEVEKLGITYDVTVDSTINMFCNPVAGYNDNLCAVDTAGNTGKILFDLTDQEIPALGVGLDNCDTIKLSYDLCMVCPGDIQGVLDYELIYDWSYFGIALHRNTLDGTQYRCNHDTREDRSICDEYSFAANDYYWELLDFDTLTYKKDRSSEVFILNDMRTPLDPVTIANQGANFLASGAPGVSEEIQPMQICNSDPDDTATGVGASVTVPANVALINAYSDAAGTMPLTKAIISDDGTYKTYKIDLPANTFTPGECDTIYVGTTLIYCSKPNEPAPKICVGTYSGCATEEVKAALAASGGCGASEVCYTYISGQSGLQTEWFDMPSTVSLCDTIYYNVRVKNVKELVLLNLVPMFDLPPGIKIVPNSWEVSHPGGEVAALNWQSIGSEPDVISGNTYSYSDDALWSSKINADGLQGVSKANAMLDSNKVAFRFRAYTKCDTFLSGSKLITKTTAVDPCSDELLTSGFVESPGVIIAGADPKDFAQLLLISDPEAVNCEATVSTFGITAINTGTNSTSDSVRICITLPEELTYTSGSLVFTTPSSFAPGNITQTVIGTKTELCFNGPEIGPYGSLSMSFDAKPDKNAECGNVRIGTDIKSFVPAVSCTPGPPAMCGVFVQNSLNSSVNIELKPPFIAEDLKVLADCAPTTDSVTLNFEYTINHNGADAVNQGYTVNFYEDFDDNQSLNTNIDSLIGSTSGTFSVNDTETVQIAGSVNVLKSKACPVIFEVVYDTDCTCDRSDIYFQNIEFENLKDLKDPITMCPNSCFDVEVCDFVYAAADSIIGATGIPYNLEIGWYGKNRYTLPHPGGASLDSINYLSMTDDTIGSGFGNFLASEGSYGGRDAWLVAEYPYPVSVSRVYVGGGSIAGWGNATQIPVYGSTPYCLQYSQDGQNWTDSNLSMSGADSHAIEENILPEPIGAPYWRIGSCDSIRNWATSEFRLEGEGMPFQAQAPITQAGNTVTICIPDGVGIDKAWEVEFTTEIGSCATVETLEVWAIGTPGLTIDADTIACENQCIDLEAVVPNDATADMTISWTPAIYFANPNDFRTTACGITGDVTLQATITYSGGACVENLIHSVTFVPETAITVSGNELNCYNTLYTHTLTADSGFSSYNWYRVVGGTKYIEFSGASNTYVPMPGGTYLVEAVNSGAPCPAVSQTLVIPSTVCEFDFGDLPDSAPGTGDETNYETSIGNNGPSHAIITGLQLGASVDDENDGQPSLDALGDGMDENGIVLPGTQLISGGIFDVPLTVQNTTGETAYLEAWIDWNADGDFDDPNEMILDLDDSGTAFPTEFRVHIPAMILENKVVGFRLRLSNQDDMTPYGIVGSGEIEDYLISLSCRPVCLPTEIKINK